MKTSIFITGLFVFALFIGGSSISNSKSAGVSGVLPTDSAPFPADVKKIMDNSCFKCHGDGGKAMAMAKLNLADWQGYSKEKQVQKVGDMYEEVSEGTMPPKKFVKENPDAVLSKEQINSFLNWRNSLKQTK